MNSVSFFGKKKRVDNYAAACTLLSVCCAAAFLAWIMLPIDNCSTAAAVPSSCLQVMFYHDIEIAVARVSIVIFLCMKYTTCTAASTINTV